MRNVTSLFACVACSLTALNALAPAASAATYFSDDFEGQTDPLSAPDVGLQWSDGGVGNSYDLTTAAGTVGAGTTSLQVIRNNSAAIPSLTAVGTSSALLVGKSIEWKFSVNTLTDPNGGGAGTPVSHNFNGPVQVTLNNGNGVTLARIGTIDGNNEYYGGSNSTTTAFGAFTNGTATAVSRNTAAYDTLRVVMTLTAPAAGTIGGTYDLFASYGGGAEVLIGDDLALVTANATGDYTRPTFTIARGSSTSTAFYDDVSIADAVPEPASLAALGGVATLLLRRRR